MQSSGKERDRNYALPGSRGYDSLDEDEWETRTHTPGFSKLWGKKNRTYKVRREFSNAGLSTDPEVIAQRRKASDLIRMKERAQSGKELTEEESVVAEENAPLDTGMISDEPKPKENLFD